MSPVVIKQVTGRGGLRNQAISNLVCFPLKCVKHKKHLDSTWCNREGCKNNKQGPIYVDVRDKSINDNC